MKNNEFVLCISKFYFDSLKEVKAQKLDVKDIFDLMDATGVFRTRKEVEYDYKYLQIIPYVVVMNNNKVYATHRLGGDERLQGKVGYLGGHVNNADLKGKVDFKETIKNCIKREMQEETTINKDFKYNILTYFYDDTNDVSKVHLCLLVVVNLDDKQAKKLSIKEKDKLAGKWYTLEELESLHDKELLENWCKLATDLLVENQLLNKNDVVENEVVEQKEK